MPCLGEIPSASAKRGKKEDEGEKGGKRKEKEKKEKWGYINN